MSKSVYLFIYLFIFSACSSSNKINSAGDQVELNLENSPNKIEINQDETTYGPTANNHLPLESKIKKEISIGIILGAGLARTLCGIGILKGAEERGIKFKAISGYEASIAVASLSAMDDDFSNLEWSLFEKYGRKNSKEIYLNSYIENELSVSKVINSNIKIENLKKFLIIPKLVPDVGVVNKGALVTAIQKTHLPFWLPEDRPVKIDLLSDSFDRIYEYMREIGIDYIIGVDYLGSSLNFKRRGESLVGRFSRVAVAEKILWNRLDLVIRPPIDEYFLDEIENPENLISKCSGFAKETFQSLGELNNK